MRAPASGSSSAPGHSGCPWASASPCGTPRASSARPRRAPLIRPPFSTDATCRSCAEFPWFRTLTRFDPRHLPDLARILLWQVAPLVTDMKYFSSIIWVVCENHGFAQVKDLQSHQLVAKRGAVL